MRDTPIPLATGHIDATELKESLKGNEQAILAIYRAIGNTTFKQAGETHLKVIDGGKNPALNINKETGDWKDHRSGDHGDIIQAVIDAEGMSFQDALKFIDGFAGGRAPVPLNPASDNNQTRSSNTRAKVVATYTYNTADGAPYMAVERTEDKQFF